MRARDWAMRCDACGTMNKETSRFCLYCGASLTTAGTEAAPATSATPGSPTPAPPLRRPAPLRPVYVPQPRRWCDQMLAGRAAFRPPEGLLVSAGLFWGLLGVSMLGVAFLRWFFTR